jgi:uncharacterized damage-inducible protein DinB
MLYARTEVRMKNAIALLLVSLLFSIVLCAQQSKSPVMDALRQSMQRAEKNIVAAAEEMPADKFNFKPTPQQMSWGKLMAHIAEGNNFFCSRLGDREQPGQGADEPKETDSKDKLVSAVKKSFDFCSSALANVNDSTLNRQVKIFGGRQASQAAVVLMTAGSWADHYGMEAMYLRVAGLTPPTAKEKD